MLISEDEFHELTLRQQLTYLCKLQLVRIVVWSAGWN